MLRLHQSLVTSRRASYVPDTHKRTHRLTHTLIIGQNTSYLQSLRRLRTFDTPITVAKSPDIGRNPYVTILCAESCAMKDG